MWLVSLIACAILWRAFLPGAVWTFLPLLITVVGIQEAVRLYYWCLYLWDFLFSVLLPFTNTHLFMSSMYSHIIGSHLVSKLLQSTLQCFKSLVLMLSCFASCQTLVALWNGWTNILVDVSSMSSSVSFTGPVIVWNSHTMWGCVWAGR